jgi:hypothetical protein
LPELSETVARLRAALAADPESIDYAALPGPARDIPELPGRLGEVLALTNGPRCGSVICWTVANLARNQFYCDGVGGREEWLCFGTNDDDPMFIHRGTGTVWWYPPSGVDRTPDDPIRELTQDAPRFFQDYAFGPGYPELAVAEDPWWRVLREQGIITQ